jgi:hypothetical protein
MFGKCLNIDYPFEFILVNWVIRIFVSKCYLVLKLGIRTNSHIERGFYLKLQKSDLSNKDSS